jgi:hypothetical protein
VKKTKLPTPCSAVSEIFFGFFTVSSFEEGHWFREPIALSEG